MDRSLINPNQLGHNGLTVHDNPYQTDPKQAMGIEIDDTDLLPFTTHFTNHGTHMAYSCLEDWM